MLVGMLDFWILFFPASSWLKFKKWIQKTSIPTNICPFLFWQSLRKYIFIRGFRINDYVFHSSLNFVNLKCQLVLSISIREHLYDCRTFQPRNFKSQAFQPQSQKELFNPRLYIPYTRHHNPLLIINRGF